PTQGLSPRPSLTRRLGTGRRSWFLDCPQWPPGLSVLHPVSTRSAPWTVFSGSPDDLVARPRAGPPAAAARNPDPAAPVAPAGAGRACPGRRVAPPRRRAAVGLGRRGGATPLPRRGLVSVPAVSGRGPRRPRLPTPPAVSGRRALRQARPVPGTDRRTHPPGEGQRQAAHARRAAEDRSEVPQLPRAHRPVEEGRRER